MAISSYTATKFVIEDFHAKTKKVTYLALAPFSTVRFRTLESVRYIKIMANGDKIIML